MLFKDWITEPINEFLSSGGGFVVDTPFNPGNSNMPVRSKTQTDDAKPENPNEKRFNPDDTFGRGFRHWRSKKSSQSDKYQRQAVPTRINRPDMA